MTSYSVNSTDLRLVQPECIWLESEQFEQAVQMSNQVISEARQWQTYLNGLGLLSFTQWLEEKLSNILISHNCCSLRQPKYANVIEAVCNLIVGEFKICLLTSESLIDEVVTVPIAAIDLPEFAAHFYVVIEVQEELETAIIRGFIRYDELVNYRQVCNLHPEVDWNYSLPLSLFDPEPNHLLFYLRFLDSAAIDLPVTSPNSLPRLSLNQPDLETLETLLDRLQYPEQTLWQTLTWEQGLTILQSPELLDLLYQWQLTSHRTKSLSIRITEVFTILTQKAINTQEWLEGKLDELAQGLGLFIPETITANSSVFRSIDKFDNVINELRYQGMDIPPEPGRSYQDIDLGEIALRLCAVTWPIDSPIPPPKWSLLLILGTQLGTPLPDGFKLQVSNLRSIIHEPVSALDDPFLFARVEGRSDEKFVVTIIPPDSSAQTLSPYAFDPS
ncbi:MAG: DUF1822 family protein [Moorea sp. SIO4E2]|uniref:DUF1822 family protein n=1 Tax=Moorena sp. SIO4E2 TaxID=2607826 RepID=UPI0013B7D7FD|nr:DUF1822 family protein [Moorena sp. SIO4E2]NEQ05788.1 DUF1822 family protein [Moorena sp. SIO4E2]